MPLLKVAARDFSALNDVPVYDQSSERDLLAFGEKPHDGLDGSMKMSPFLIKNEAQLVSDEFSTLTLKTYSIFAQEMKVENV